MKRAISLLLVIITLTTVIFAGTIPTSAASTTKVNNFSKNITLNYTQYDLLRTGKINAVKEGGVWYYTFTKNKNVLKVKVAAFSGGVDNNYASVNSVLEKGIRRTDGKASQATFAYKKRTGTSTIKRNAYTAIAKFIPTNVKSYTTYFSWLTITSNRPGNGISIDLECKKNGHAEFVYSDKVYVNNFLKGRGYKAPSSAKEYLSALKRTVSNTVSTTMTPNFDVTVSTPGKNRVELNSFQLRGKGIADTKTDVSKYISVAMSTKALIENALAKKLYGTLTNLYSLYGAVGAMRKKSSEYASNNKIYLSKDKTDTGSKKTKSYHCIRSSFKSPIKLKVNGDYFRTELKLSKAPTTSGKKTVINVSFSIK